MSYTELEFDTATEAGLPRLLFLLDEDAVLPIPPNQLLDGDSDLLARQRIFRQRLLDAALLTVKMTNPDQLEISLLHSLVALQSDSSKNTRARRSILVLCEESTRELGMLLARELAPDAGVMVWPVELGLSLIGGGAQGLLSRLNEIDLAVIIPNSKYLDMTPQQWFEIGAVVGGLGPARTLLVTSDSIGGMAAWAKLPSLSLSPNEGDAEKIRSAASRISSQLFGLEPRSEMQPEAYSCILSYADADSEFAFRLASDLQDSGIACWLDRADISVSVGDSDELRRKLAGQDKLLLILSEHSVNSKWVEEELRQALELESERRRGILVPVVIDDSLQTSANPRMFELFYTRVSYFTTWSDEKNYRYSLRRLVKDLTFSAVNDASPPDAAG
jgi:hypothetical protein